MPETNTLELMARDATAAALSPYGTLIEPVAGGKPFGDADARLALGGGTPRFYIMELTRRPWRLSEITRHRQVTQALAALQGQDWWMVLAPPDTPDEPTAQPDRSRLAAFRFNGRQALVLHRGTWHAGPLFTAPSLPFVNLELSDTNEADHHTVPLTPAVQLRIG